MTNPLKVVVDWAKSGATTGDADVTLDVRGATSAEFGRDQATALSPIVAGRGSFDLDNTSRKYSPRNTGSPLFGNLKPARPVTVTRTVGATTYTIFQGHTDDSPVNPDVNAKRVTLNLVDTLADFRGVTVATPLYQGITSGQAIGYVLDAAGWTGGRDLDVGSSTFPWWWVDGTDAMTALQDILASEGAPALLTISSTGAMVFRDRQHRYVDAGSLTPQTTFRGDGLVEPVMSPGFAYSDAWANVVNSVSFSISERRPWGFIAVVWDDEDAVLGIGASQSSVVVLATSDPFKDAVTPVEGTDFNVLAGSITNVTLSRTSGSSTSITFTAGASGATIKNVQLRARSVPVVRTRQFPATDSTSVTDYGQKGVDSAQVPTWCSRQDAQSLANLLVAQRKQPLPLLTARFVCGDAQTTRLAALLALDLSDRVTVVEPETQVNGDYFVESISHTIADVTEHEIVFGLEAVPTTPTSVFRIGTSVLGGSDLLGY
jgi:hypothetical protein